MKKIILKYRYCIWLLGGVICSARLASQPVDSSYTDLDFLRHSHAWLSSGQATGLQFIPVAKISYASLSARKADGKFKNFYQSDDSYTLNATTESFYRLNQRVVFQGKVDYEYFKGKNMGGSAFVDPYKNAIDIDEYADSTTGQKKMERYLLMGTVSAQLNSRLTLAGSVNYSAANYAKLKDLRHSNKLLDLHAQAGASYRLNSKWMLGASYAFSRRVESVSFNIYGNTNRQYLSLINFGSFYGLSELHSDYGYTSQTTPLTDLRHTGALQIGWTIKPGVQLFQQVSYQRRSGYYGEKGSASIVYTEHEGHQYSSASIISLAKENSLQYFRLAVAYEKLENFENVYTAGTAPGGNRVITYFGQNRVLNQGKTSLEGEYAVYWNIKNNQPGWILQAIAGYANRDQTVIRYPYYRKQAFNSYDAHLTAKRNWSGKAFLYTASLGVGYGSGSGNAKTDGTYIPPSSSQIPPASRDLYLQQEYEFFTSPRAEIIPSVQLSHKINKQVLTFVRLSWLYTKAWETVYTGKDFQTIAINLGCYF
ncbi:MAG: hypothetical protein E6Q24_04380 [Chitinophagaceae bacterium]|nr:MAG: hypothetical protein E6Q24_04380 [Chitinophagaceae bacterium]